MRVRSGNQAPHARAGRAPRRRSAVLLPAAALVLGFALEVPPAEATDAGSLLAGSRPTRQRGVDDGERLTDGVAPVDGDEWLTDAVARLQDSRASVEWDLGAPRDIGCAFLIGDNNDAYTFEIGDQPGVFRPLWTAGPTGGAGMRMRTTRELAARGRYLRLSAQGGDGAFSVGELGLAERCAGEWPPALLRRAGESVTHAAQVRLWGFAVVAILWILLDRRGGGRARLILPGLAAAVGLWAAWPLARVWPLAESELSLIRAVVAAIGIAVVLREALSPARFRPESRRFTVALVLLAVLSVGTYYRYGAAQFHDQKKGRGTLVHPWDMRVYFPIAKYFDELRFDGLYLASLAAYLDNTGLPAAAVAEVRLRDLTNNEMKRAADVAAEVQAVRGRFSPARWTAFRADMQYFMDVMGAGGYLGSLTDHGGNATPVWFLAAHLLFRSAPAGELALSLAGGIDMLLLCALLLAIGRTFGLRPALWCAIIYGATDFSRFGTNLMGSTLRLDWMAALGFGVCALGARRYLLGGALLAHAGLIRAFPALGAMFLAVPPAWWLVGFLRGQRRLPRLAEVRAAQRPFLRTATGVGLGLVVLVGVSAAVLPGAWRAWTAKIRIHAESPSINNVGLRNIAGYESAHIAAKVLRPGLAEPWVDWQRYQVEAIERRWPVRLATVLGALVLAVLACRGRSLGQAALVGTLLVPVLFYPSNYYCHYVFLLPLLAPPRRAARSGNAGNAGSAGDAADAADAAVAAVAGGALVRALAKHLPALVLLVLLVMCVAQYPTLAEGWGDLLYTNQTIILLAGFGALLVLLAATAVRSATQSPPPPPPSPSPPPPAPPAPASGVLPGEAAPS